MAYFSNGSEARDYQARYCERCVHDTNYDCPVWGAHLMFAKDGGPEAKNILDNLIPRSADGLTNERCALFVAVEP